MKYLNVKCISFWIAILSIAMLTSCDYSEPALDNEKMPLVVEGWIEDGEYPIVLVTRAADMTGDIKDFDQFVQRWCRVSIDDGETKHYLSGRVDKNYTPSLIYTSHSFVGEIGRSYLLSVETDQDTVWAVSELPHYLPIDSVKVLPCIDNDSLYQIRVFADFKPGIRYKFYVKTRGSDTRYYSSMFGTFSGETYDSTQGYDVRRGKHASYDGDTFQPYFREGEVVSVKLCVLDEANYQFWTTYENALSLSSNLFYPFTQNCPTNIEGGKGIWGAYGISCYHVAIQKR